MRRTTLAILALAALALPACSTAASAAGAPPGITARGTGTATATPDTAKIVLGVQARDVSAEAALRVASELAGGVIGVLEGAGVPKADITTTRMSVQPTIAPEDGRVTGYEVTNQVTATLRDTTKAGPLIDQAAAVAGNAVRVQQIDFSIADESAVRAEARADAVRRAVEQAQQLAEAAGVELGGIRTITELPLDGPAPLQSERADAQPAVPIEPGTQEVRVAVEVVHDIG